METLADPRSAARRSRGLYLVCALCVVTCAGLFAGFGIRSDPVDNEVFNLYAGARLGPQELYHPESFRAVAESLGAKVIEARFYYCRMPYYAVFTKPLCWLPYPAAVVVWRSIQMLAIAAAVFLWPGWKPAMAMVAMVSLPAVC